MANIFPRWTNKLPLAIAVCVALTAAAVVSGFWLIATPKTTDVGYAPDQPIAFSHKLHVDELGLDCRYCHSFVEYSGVANIPSANTCWTCHMHVRRDSERLVPLLKAMDKNYVGYTGEAIRWRKVHKLPDYVYFNHSAHVNRGIGCQSCHGDVNKMEVVSQAKNLSMGWCLECHRAPENFLRPNEEVFKFNYDPATYIKDNKIDLANPALMGNYLKQKWSINPRQNCNTCHQ